jgi:phosphate starvation-inducible protein PhoH and related proteins
MLCKYQCVRTATQSTKMTSSKIHKLGEQNLSARRKAQHGRRHIDESAKVIGIENYVQKRTKSVVLLPKTLKQEEYIDLLTDYNRTIVFATGPAGTGKTMLAVMAGIKAFKERAVDRIVITRPAVGVDDEQHGFLPGDLNAKMEPWTRPIMDVVMEYYTTRDIANMLEEQTIEISPLAYMRGRNFKRSWIIFDEAQNATTNQMKMVLTRLSEGSKLIVTGDLNQQDRKFKADNGLRDFLDRLREAGSAAIASVDFGRRDVQRHPTVAEVLKLYGED